LPPFAIFNPLCAPLISSRTPSRPRTTKPRKNASQKWHSRSDDTAKPSTSRASLMVTPMAITMACDTTRPVYFIFTNVASD
jgi:hypothetical protein